MRLSLLEHDQQQQRQLEEEERNRRNGETSERGRSTEAGNNGNLTVPSSGQRPSSVVLPGSVGGRISPQSSSSVPNNNPLDGLQTSGSWRSDSSQFSTLAAALNAVNSESPIPLPSSAIHTGGTDGDTTTISSESSGTGRSSTRPPPDAVEEGVNYTPLPSSPESPGLSPPSFLRTGYGGAIAGSRSRTPE